MNNFGQSVGNPTQGGVGFCCTFSLCLRVPFLNCLQHPVGAESQELVQARGGDRLPPHHRGGDGDSLASWSRVASCRGRGTELDRPSHSEGC